MVGEERQVIHAHRCFLAARCEVFRAMFAIDKKEESASQFILTDLRPKTFLSLLEYIYTNCCTISSETVIDIMSSSIEYGLDGLTRVSGEKKRKRKSFREFVSILSLSIRSSLDLESESMNVT